MHKPDIILTGPALDCPNAIRLAEFYLQLMTGWRITYTDDEFVAIHSADESQRLLFQTVESYTAPVWPWKAGCQQPMMHLDFAVDDVDAAVVHALACGAVKASAQFFEPDWIVTLLDPAGHPFCIGRR